jgi:[ribosomal protein S5]-alanine N-acetyltransferase
LLFLWLSSGLADSFGLKKGLEWRYESIYPMSADTKSAAAVERSGDGELEVLGPGLLLRYARPDDAARLFELASDSEVTRFFSWGPYTAQSQAVDYISNLARKRADGSRLEFVIEHPEAGVIGVTGLSEFAVRDRRAVVGTWHGREWWGSGANRQSKTLVLALAFAGLRLGRVTAWCGTDNGRSQTALERLGFVHEGVLRQWHVHDGEPKDVISYSMLRGEWEQSDLAREPYELRGRIPPQFLHS